MLAVPAQRSGGETVVPVTGGQARHQRAPLVLSVLAVGVWVLGSLASWNPWRLRYLAWFAHPVFATALALLLLGLRSCWPHDGCWYVPPPWC